MKMTIDEAIEILKTIRDGWDMSLCHGYEHVDAMDMAIEALKRSQAVRVRYDEEENAG